MHKIREMLMDELKEIEKEVSKSSSDRLSPGKLQTVHMITDTIKNIDKIKGMEEGGYSSATDFMGEGRMYGVSYDRAAYPRYYREGEGSFEGSSYDSDSSYRRRRNSMGRYSRHDGADRMSEKLEEMMDEAGTEKERNAIRRCMEELKQH